jgi:hypothetical protein
MGIVVEQTRRLPKCTVQLSEYLVVCTNVQRDFCLQPHSIKISGKLFIYSVTPTVAVLCAKVIKLLTLRL